MTPRQFQLELRPREEVRDLLLLCQIAVAVLLVWVLVLGWTIGCYIAAGDSLSLDLPGYLELLRQNGVWENVTYRAGPLGGVNLGDVWGTSLTSIWSAKLGLAPRECFNSYIFLTQISLAFLGVRFLRPGFFLWNVLRALLFAFSPFIALRLAQGHYVMVMVMTFFSSAFLFLHELRRREITLTLLAVFSFVALSAFGHQSYQFYLYSLVFGGPFLAVALLHGPADRTFRTRLAALCLLVIGCALVSAPRILSQVEYAFGPDADRGVSSPDVIYSYTTATAADWLSSLFWSLELVPTGRAPSLLHETNVPMGPFLVFFLLLASGKNRRLFLAACASAVLAVVFSMDLEPLSGWLAAAVPPLRHFRVPERAMLPFVVLLPWLSLKAIEEAALPGGAAVERKDVLNRPAAAALALSIAVFLSPQLPRELAGWVAAALLAALVVAPGLWPGIPRRTALVCAALVLTAAELAAFAERLPRFRTDREVLDPLERTREGALAQKGEQLLRPLRRSHFDSAVNEVINKGAVMGIPTIEAYAHPTRRFARLLYSLKGEPVDPTAVVFADFRTGSPFWNVLERLFNVRFFFRRNGSEIVELREGFGEAWFSSRVALVDDYAGLARSLYGGMSPLLLQVVATDPQVPRWSSPPAFSPGCSSARIRSVEAALGGQEIRIGTATSADCPLTVSTNYVSRATAVAVLASGGRRAIRPFPGYGTLLTVIAPAGTRSVEIGFPPYRPGWGQALFWIGLLLLLPSILLLARARAAGGGGIVSGGTAGSTRSSGAPR